MYVRGRKVRLSRKQEILLARRAIALVLLLAIVILTVTAVWRKAIPIAMENAASLTQLKWETLITKAVEETMQEENYRYDLLATQSTDAGGKLTALSVNSTALAALRGAISGRLNHYFLQNSKLKIPVPLGSVVLPRFFQGIGPKIKVNTLTYTAFCVVIKSEVSAVGINQTMHRITAAIVTETTLYCADEKSNFTHSYDVILAESIAFGSIPNSYFEYGS